VAAAALVIWIVQPGQPAEGFLAVGQQQLLPILAAVAAADLL